VRVPVKLRDSWEVIEFHHLDGRNIPLQPWPQKFWVSAYAVEDCAEIRPVTFAAIAKAVAQNFVSMSWWRFRWAFFRLGFLDCPEGAQLSFRRHWRWDFWKVRAARLEVSD
jgi:hypothetical protein